MTLVFGLTGGMASGKSTVAARFRVNGIPIVDADALAREVVEPGSQGLRAVVDRFGESVLDVDGRLDRRRLGRLVFGHPEARRALDAIVHPRVGMRFAEEVAEATRRGEPLLGYDVPLLFENGLEQRLRPVILVAASEATQLSRAMARDGLSREEALARLAAQLPLADKLARADIVIHNDADRASLERRVDEVSAELRRRAG